MTHDEAVDRARLTVTRCGGRVFRYETGLFTDLRGRRHLIGTKGASDLIGLTATGRALSIEVKTGQARRTPEQEAWARMWRESGGLYVLARYPEPGDEGVIAAVATG